MTKKIDYNKWHSGPPPSVGWWPASICKDKQAVRWWNGVYWSEPAWPDTSPSWAATMANRKTGDEKDFPVEWQHRPASWPARSRT